MNSAAQSAERSSLYDTVDAWLSRVEDAAAFAAAGILLAMMVLVSLDALFRYLFHAPLAFQYTLTEDYLMVAVVTLALPWAFRTGGYIRISGMIQLMPYAVRTLILRIGMALSFVYVAALAWTGGKSFLKVWTSGEVRIGVIDWPVWASWIWVPIGCGLLALRVLLLVFAPAEDLNADPHGDV